MIEHALVLQFPLNERRNRIMSITGADDIYLPRLARIDPRQFDLLFGGCKVERYAAGQHLFVQEDASDRIYGVMSGTGMVSTCSVARPVSALARRIMVRVRSPAPASRITLTRSWLASPASVRVTASTVGVMVLSITN